VFDSLLSQSKTADYSGGFAVARTQENVSDNHKNSKKKPEQNALDMLYSFS